MSLSIQVFGIVELELARGYAFCGPPALKQNRASKTANDGNGDVTSKVSNRPAGSRGHGKDQAVRLDPRLNAYRSDIAARMLEGKVDSRRFVQGEAFQVTAPAAPLRRLPSSRAGLDSEVLFGERVMLYDVAEGWAWVQLERDGYVGYLPSQALTRHLHQATHRVAAIGTFVYPAADIKAPPVASLSMNAMLCVTDAVGQFLKLAGGGYVIARHAADLAHPALDFVEIAERFIGTPYLWGGRTRLGLDCSGLVQVALEAAGKAAPRDSDMQQQGLGDTVLVPADLEGLRRGDLIFWPGHVGIMTDGTFLLHANAKHMATAIETLQEANSRMTNSGAALSAIKRITL